MSLDLDLKRLAIHYVDKKTNRLEHASQEQNVEVLSTTIIKFFLDLVSEVWTKEDKGPNRSAGFVPDDDAKRGPSVVKQNFEDLCRQGGEHFFRASKALATHLYQQTPGTASPGILAIMQLKRHSDRETFIAILKIRHKDERFVRVLSQALTQLDVEQVNNMLLSDIQKGAIIPHPHKDNYDLKLIDKNVADDPAQYFAEGFLGCLSKKSDEHQVKKLLPELSQFAQKRGLPLMKEKIPDIVNALQEQGTNITTSVIAEIVHNRGIFGPDLQLDDFKTYLNEESTLGPIDIPPDRFNGRGKTFIPRKITIKFRDRNLRGVTISGPAETLTDILSIEGDMAIFHIETTRNNYDINYE